MSSPLAIHKTSYSVLDFLEWQRRGTLDLQPYYQRRSVWNPKVKSLFIDSLIRGYPVPLIFMHNRLDIKTSQTIRQVVDGQQRLRTLLAYIDPDCIPNKDDRDDFRILRLHNKEHAGKAFADLPDDVQTGILQTSLSVNLLPTDIDNVTILEIFRRMNSTGVKLNDQEIRNGSYFGLFKTISYDLAYQYNQRWSEWGLFNTQEIAQMREVEFTSELLGALIRGVSGRTKSQIDGLYEEFEETFEEQDAIVSEFDSSMNYLAQIYDGRTISPLPGRFNSTTWFYPLFAISAGLLDSDSDPKNEIDGDLPPSQNSLAQVPDVESLSAALTLVDSMISHPNSAPEALRLSEEVRESLRRQTTHKASRLRRIRLIRSALEAS